MNRFKGLYIKKLTLVIIFGQVVSFFLITSGYLPLDYYVLSPAHILSGQVWRIVTFIFLPPSYNPILAFFAWYIFFIMGGALEHYWGERKFNIYILTALIFTNLAAFIIGFPVYTNYYILGSVSLAFAFLYPNFQLRIFFIIPVKIKWLAALTWILYSYSFIFDSIAVKGEIAASVINFFIFFSRDIYYKIRYRGRDITETAKKKINENRPVHSCDICGISDKDYPGIEFRYCSKCEPHKCICENCLESHTH